MKRWQEVVPEAERAHMQRVGFGGGQAFGAKPALLIVDVTRGFVGSERKPIAESMKEYPTSCGEVGWAAMEKIKVLLDACRGHHIPVVYTTGDPYLWQFMPGPTKNNLKPVTSADWRGEDIPDMIAPLSTELVLHKARASAFVGTPLLLYLNYKRIDTLIIAGTTTSGCVRSTVIDAFANGFTCFVAEECTFDRVQTAHLSNLYDMNAKVADVITVDDVLKYIARV